MKAAHEAEEMEKKAAQEEQERRAEFNRLAPISPPARHRVLVTDNAYDQIEARNETSKQLLKIVKLQAEVGEKETELRQAKLVQEKAGRMQEVRIQKKRSKHGNVPVSTRALEFGPIPKNGAKRGAQLQTVAAGVSGYSRGELQRTTRRMKTYGHIAQVNHDAKKPGYKEPPLDFQINTDIMTRW